jgi:hypothetical protein
VNEEMGETDNDQKADQGQTAFLRNEFCARLSDVRQESREQRSDQVGKAIDAEMDIETFYAKAPRFQPNASLIKGVVCGIRVEEIEDETMRKIRYLDKLIDELAKGKAMEKILRK